MRPVLVLILTSMLTGCLTSEDNDGLNEEVSDYIESNSDIINSDIKEWEFIEYHTMGYYVGVLAGGLRAVLPENGYCWALGMDVPRGATILNVTFVSKPIDTANSSVGLIGISAASENYEQWVGYPDEYNPSESYLDEVKPISIPNPKPGRWGVWLYGVGPVVHALGNVTIELQGEGQAPQSLNVEMLDSFNEPCTDDKEQA